MDTKPIVPVHSLGKAMQLLDLLLASRRPLSLAELTELSGFPKSTVYTLLSSMRAYSYIEQRPDGKYYLGIRMYECGRAVSAQWDISQAARPYLERLAELTGACAVVTYLKDGHIIHLDQCAGRVGVQVLSEVGIRLPIHATAQGKLFLAGCKDAEVRALLGAHSLPAFTPHTLTSAEEVLAQLPRIRSDGYAVENGEYKIGLRAVCAPVLDPDGAPCYAVGVAGLFRHVDSAEFEEAIAAVCACARQISAALGYR